MAEKVPVTCPECAKQVQAPAEIIGRKIRCKNCNAVFVAKKPEGSTQPKKVVQKKGEKAKTTETVIPLKEDDDEGDGKPYEVTSLDDTPRCPECANELESEEALVCLFCGFNLKTRAAARTRKIKDVTGKDHFMWLLPGILAALGFFLSIGAFIGMIIYALMKTWEVNTDQMYINFFNCVVLWWCLACIFLGYKTCRFAIKRLINEPTPPEEEL